MNISVSGNLTVKEVKDNFHNIFKNLALEFYTKKHEENEGSLKEFQLGDNAKMSELMESSISGELEFDGSIKISELEQIFEDTYGLHVQVFRKHGATWLQTTKTDHWTLNEAENWAEEFDTID